MPAFQVECEAISCSFGYLLPHTCICPHSCLMPVMSWPNMPPQRCMCSFIFAVCPVLATWGLQSLKFARHPSCPGLPMHSGGTAPAQAYLQATLPPTRLAQPAARVVRLSPPHAPSAAGLLSMGPVQQVRPQKQCHVCDCVGAVKCAAARPLPHQARLGAGWDCLCVWLCVLCAPPLKMLFCTRSHLAQLQDARLHVERCSAAHVPH